jgi:signal transduction histidine kinase
MNNLPKILYIDDEPENLVGFRISFSKLFNISTAENTIDGYLLMQKNEFQVILVDYKMPGENGITFIERIKEEFADVVFIVISGYAELDVVINAININCIKNFVQKPWNYNEMKIMLYNATESYQIRKENKTLMNMLVEKNLQLAESVEREKSLNELKSVFLRNVSHEIRTPLNAIIGFASIVKEEVEDLSVKSHIDICIQNSYKLLRVIEDIILASVLTTNQVEINKEEFSLAQLIDDLMFSRNNRCLNNSFVDFINEVDPEIIIRNDKDKVRTAIDLLIDNANKFTEVGFVKISAVEKSEEEIEVHVSDSGIGIDEEKLKIIFEPFRQSDETNVRRFGGNGLGLFLSRTLIEILGGKIWCYSENGNGTTFSFSLKNS